MCSVNVSHVCLLCRFTSCLSFYSILNELNDYAGQREVVAEEMAHKVYGELMRYSQDLKAERKHVSKPTSLSFPALVFHSCLSIIKTTLPRKPVASCHGADVAVFPSLYPPFPP